MFVKINYIAQNLMDSYYQDEKPDEEFFQFYHFRYMAISVYAAIMQTEWEQGYGMSRNEGEGAILSPVPPEWFVPEEVTLTGSTPNYIATLKIGAFVFSKDKSSSGILSVTAEGLCSDFIRINAYETFGLSMAPKTNKSFWYPFGKGVNIYSQCGLSKVTIYRIPAIDTENIEQDTDIPAMFEEKIRINVLQYMLGAKSGNVVDFTANYNTNKTVASEIADYIKKQTQPTVS